MATYFQNILSNAKRKGIVGQTSKDSVDWFRKNVRKTTNINTNKLMKEEADRLVNSWTSIGIGKMYFVHYDPKHKKTLPYYDTFPIIIPIQKYEDGFLSINLHYLPPILRAKLLDALYDTLNNDRYDEKTKMVINYKILKAATKYKYFQPCVKRYLGKHIRSRFLRVDPNAWTAAVFLPVENFSKASKTTVWQDSRDIIEK